MAAKKKKKKSGKNGKIRLILWSVPVLIMIASVSIRLSGMGKSPIPPPGSYQLEVLNGTGEKNLVKRITLRLRRIGMDVLIEGNAESFDFEQSIIIDRKGNRNLAESVARRLGCRRVIQQIQVNPKVDLTFVVGSDWDKLDIDIQGED